MPKSRDKIICVDTNVVLRLILADDEVLYRRAREIFKEGEAGRAKIYVDEVVLAECVWVLKSFYKKSREQIHEVLSRLVSLKYMANPRSKLARESLLIYKTTSLSLEDCWLMVLSKNQSYELRTFDVKLRKKAGMIK